MPIHLLTSVTGSPGVTTTAVAWATLTDTPTLLIEADMTGGSAVLAGPFRGQIHPERTILNLAEFAQPEMAAQLWWSSLTIPGTEQRVLPTIANPAQARALAGAWGDIAEAISQTSHETGSTILIDYGRLSTQAAGRPLLGIADTILVLTPGTMAGVNSTRRTVEILYGNLAREGLPQRLAVVPVLPGAVSRRHAGNAARPWGTAEIVPAFAIPSSDPTRPIQLPVLPPIAYDPDAAAVYSAGVIPPRNAKPYLASIREMAAAADDLATRIATLTGKEKSA